MVKRPQAKAQPSTGASEVVNVFVPCGVAGPYDDTVKLLRGSHPALQLKSQIANVTTLKRLLLDGKATCDVYLALGDVEVQQLTEAGKVAKTVPLVGNGLGLIVGKGNPRGIKGIQDLVSDKVKAIALAKTDTTGGARAEQALRNAGVWEKIKQKVARPETPDELKNWVAQGKADAAIIYSTCMVEVHRPGKDVEAQKAAAASKIEDVGVIDPSLYDPFHVIAVVPKNAPNPKGADIFIETCLSPQGQAKWAQWQFVPIEKASGKAG